jgi:hypothetical protein
MLFALLAYCVLLIGAIAANLLFTKLILLEYTSYRTQREQDGRPIGPLFFIPHECTTLGRWVIHPGTLAMWRASLVWLFSPPAWARGSARAMHLIRWLRITSCLNLVAFIGLIVAFFRLWRSANHSAVPLTPFAVCCPFDFGERLRGGLANERIGIALTADQLRFGGVGWQADFA